MTGLHAEPAPINANNNVLYHNNAPCKRAWRWGGAGGAGRHGLVGWESGEVWVDLGEIA
jgi:hypothetical protein